MEQSISATEARVHFGQWLRRVKEQDMTLIVEKGGRPEAVLLSVKAYEKLQGARQRDAGTEALARARASRDRIRARRGEALSPPEEVIATLREERDGDFPGLR